MTRYQGGKCDPGVRRLLSYVVWSTGYETSAPRHPVIAYCESWGTVCRLTRALNADLRRRRARLATGRKAE